MRRSRDRWRMRRGSVAASGNTAAAREAARCENAAHHGRAESEIYRTVRFLQRLRRLTSRSSSTRTDPAKWVVGIAATPRRGGRQGGHRGRAAPSAVQARRAPRRSRRMRRRRRAVADAASGAQARAADDARRLSRTCYGPKLGMSIRECVMNGKPARSPVTRSALRDLQPVVRYE
jgi:hypothetical protein